MDSSSPAKHSIYTYVCVYQTRRVESCTRGQFSCEQVQFGVDFLSNSFLRNLMKFSASKVAENRESIEVTELKLIRSANTRPTVRYTIRV